MARPIHPAPRPSLLRACHPVVVPFDVMIGGLRSLGRLGDIPVAELAERAD